MELNNLAFYLAIILAAAQLSLVLSQSSTTKSPSSVESVICQNNGTLSTVTSNSSICLCSSPWSGETCSDYACVNGLPVGDLYEKNSTFFNKRCLCDPGYTGELCDSLIVNPCGSHGRLINKICVCDANYTGSKCESVEYCLNGQFQSGRCNCRFGWSSDFCDKILCHQGISDETNSNCTCKVGYRGQFCDFCAEDDTSPYPECLKITSSNLMSSKPFIIITGVVLAILCASFCLILMVLLRRKQKLRSRRRRSDRQTDDSLWIETEMQPMRRTDD